MFLSGGFGGVSVSGNRVYVQDRVTQPSEQERLLCFDAESGRLLWSHADEVSYGKLDYGNGPRSTPTVHAGKVYTLGALGHLHCLDARSGNVLWSHDTVKQFRGRVPTWGHACSPLVDGKRLVSAYGNAASPGDEVGMRPPGVLLPDNAPDWPRDTAAPRLALAKWITDQANPLTARVMHRVTVVHIDGLRIRVNQLEALHGTPIVDVKPILKTIEER